MNDDNYSLDNLLLQLVSDIDFQCFKDVLVWNVDVVILIFVMIWYYIVCLFFFWLWIRYVQQFDILKFIIFSKLFWKIGVIYVWGWGGVEVIYSQYFF